MGRIRKIYNGYAVPAALPSTPKIMREIPAKRFRYRNGLAQNPGKRLGNSHCSFPVPQSR